VVVGISHECEHVEVAFLADHVKNAEDDIIVGDEIDVIRENMGRGSVRRSIRVIEMMVLIFPIDTIEMNYDLVPQLFHTSP
jgi:hypothetical protein